MTFNVPQLYSDGIGPGLKAIDVTYSMSSQIRPAILKAWYLVLSV